MLHWCCPKPFQTPNTNGKYIQIWNSELFPKQQIYKSKRECKYKYAMCSLQHAHLFMKQIFRKIYLPNGKMHWTERSIPILNIKMERKKIYEKFKWTMNKREKRKGWKQKENKKINLKSVKHWLKYINKTINEQIS